MASSDTLKYFDYAHLPTCLQEVSRPICELAQLLHKTIPDSIEKDEGMRRLLEAKDCFVRASINTIGKGDSKC